MNLLIAYCRHWLFSPYWTTPNTLDRKLCVVLVGAVMLVMAFSLQLRQEAAIELLLTNVARITSSNVGFSYY